MATTIGIPPKKEWHSKKIDSIETENSVDSPNFQQESISVKIQDLVINGFVSKSRIANFLNIPYARIPARFRQATLINPRKEKGTIEATKFGPCCPQPVDQIHFTTSHLYPKMIDVQHASEFSCLSLNIYAPPEVLFSGAKLPVIAWIHGGGFTYGDAADEYGKHDSGSYMPHF